MTQSAAALSCSRVTKRFGRLTALDAVTVSVQAGECLTLFGRNGAGKSTLLGVASGLTRFYEGEVLRFGTDVRRADDASRSSIGFVSHETFLYGDLSPTDNLRFYGRLYGIDDPAGSADAMLERFGLVHKAGVPVRSLSRGMQQRLSLARATLHKPQLLLFDEPFTGLDEPACELLTQLLRDFVSAGGAAVVTTHDIDRGLGVANRIAVLEKGRIVHEAAANETDAASFRETYRGLLAPGGG
jgi:heme exporter protein A